MVSELPKRNNIRLQGYDYSATGHYFITICVRDRKNLLGTIVGDGVLDVPHCELTEIGKRIDLRIQAMNDIYDDIKTEKYIIMPNHVHMIIFVPYNSGSSRTPTPTNEKIPAYISTLKRYTNKECGFSFWQRSYYDHIIRNDTEYQRICKYIDDNPATLCDDRYYICE